MSTVGMIGLGKLGLPVALAIESRGHTVLGYDRSSAAVDCVVGRHWPHRELQVPELLAATKLRLVPVPAMVREADLLFVAVQTPHGAAYGGEQPMPAERADFDYTALRAAVSMVEEALESAGLQKPVCVISTVLPGTMEREIQPLCRHAQLCYTPQFIAMGTTVPDFLNPEFTLLGADPGAAADTAAAFFETLHDRVIYRTAVKNAELIKVAYNTFITQKLVFANTLMEICHKIGADVDQVTDALGLAVQRVISPAYLSGGMGDGGACHPRDNIALSWLARRLNLSYDVFSEVIRAREQQSRWLLSLIAEQAGALPVFLLGESYKANVGLTDGSPALLLSHQLTGAAIPHTVVDPYTGRNTDAGHSGPALFFISAKHDYWHRFPFAAGDVVLDPWRAYRTAVERAGARYIGIGAAP